MIAVRWPFVALLAALPQLGGAQPKAAQTAVAQTPVEQSRAGEPAVERSAAEQPGGELISLEEAVRIARANHPALRRARAEVKGAAAGVDAALAPLLPQVQANAAWQYQDRPGVQLGSTFVRNRGQTYSAGLSLNQQITDFGRTTSRLRASRALEEAQQATLSDIEDLVLANVRQAFFTARARKSLLSVASRTLENQRRHLEQVSAFVELGERAPYDLAQAQTNVGVARSRLASAEGELRIAKAALVQAMGIDRSSDIDVTDESLPPISGEEGPTEELLPEALAARPDLVALDKRIDAQQLFVRASTSGYLPILGASGNVSGVGPAFHDLEGPSWVAGITLVWPLFEGGATRAAVAQAESSLVALEADREALAQRIRFEVEQSLAAIRTAHAARDAADERLLSASEQRRLAEGRYETGTGSLLELSDAELALQEAEAARVQAEYDLAAARALLLERLGRR